MGRDPAEPATPDLFSFDGVKAAVPSSPMPSEKKEATEATPQRHILPKNLRHAVSQLSDGELDELFEVTFAEAKRRGRLPRSVRTELTPEALRPSELGTKRRSAADKLKPRRVDIAEIPLTRGQLNAVRSAYKAGITPSRIARQFRISQANVRKASASEESRR
jgi:hypothetical protein